MQRPTGLSAAADLLDSTLNALLRVRPLHRALLLAAGLLCPCAALAEITPDSNPSSSLGTLVNGTSQPCAASACSVTGGTSSGTNLFHRFLEFDTRQTNIETITFDNSNHSRLFVGVTNPTGTFITSPVFLSSAGHLYWLSPGGIQIQGGGAFGNVANLQLSTATSLAFSGGRSFDFDTTTAKDIPALSGSPLGFFTSPEKPLIDFGDGKIAISNQLAIDSALLLDSRNNIVVNGMIQTSGGSLSAKAKAGFALSGLVATEGGDVSILSEHDLVVSGRKSRVDSLGPTGGINTEGGNVYLVSSTGWIRNTFGISAESGGPYGFLSAGTGKIALKAAGFIGEPSRTELPNIGNNQAPISYVASPLLITSAAKLAAESASGSILINYSPDQGEAVNRSLVIGNIQVPDFLDTSLLISGLEALQGNFNVRASGDVVIADTLRLVGNDYSRISANFGESRIEVAPGAVVTTQTGGQIVLQGLLDNRGSLLVDRGPLELDGLVHQSSGSIEILKGADLRFDFCPDNCLGSTLSLLEGSRLSGMGSVSGRIGDSTVGTLTQQAGSRISPGSGDGEGSLGTLTFNNLTWAVQNAAVLRFDLGSTDGVSDQINLKNASSAVFSVVGHSPDVVIQLAEPLNPPPEGSLFTLITNSPEGVDFTALNTNAQLKNRILGTLEKGSIQFAFAGLESQPNTTREANPEPDPSPEPNPNPRPRPKPKPDPDPNPDPDPDPEPNPTPNPDPDPEPNPNPDPDPEPDPKPDLDLEALNQLQQPIIPPWASGPAAAQAHPEPQEPAAVELMDQLRAADPALHSRQDRSDAAADTPLILGLEPRSGTLASAQLNQDEAGRVEVITSGLPGVERPGCAPQAISNDALQPLLMAAQRDIRRRAGGRFSTYQPAILSMALTEEPTGRRSFVDLTLFSAQGEPSTQRVKLSSDRFGQLLRDFYRQMARRDAINPADPQSPVRQLHQALIAPIEPQLQQRGITSLLIATDQGLQAVPFAALHNGANAFGERYALSITPSLRFTCLEPPKGEASRLLAAGASSFQGLAALPLVPQEIDGLVAERPADSFLNQHFTPRVLLEQAADTRYDRVHVATHAEFLPGGVEQSRIYTGTGAVTLAEFSRMRDQRDNDPLELFSLSACRTAVGDRDSELGFAGLALQAGARSAIGTLWYVDDVATSAVFLQLYRYLDDGYPKAEALQATRQDLIAGRIRLAGDRVLAADGQPLLQNLTLAQRQRIREGLSHPFFWAGITLLGSPW